MPCNAVAVLPCMRFCVNREKNEIFFLYVIFWYFRKIPGIVRLSVSTKFGGISHLPVCRVAVVSGSRTTNRTRFSQVHYRSDHADSLDDDTVHKVRATHEKEGCREDRDPPENDNDECGVLTAEVHTPQLKVRG